MGEIFANCIIRIAVAPAQGELKSGVAPLLMLCSKPILRVISCIDVISISPEISSATVPGQNPGEILLELIKL